MKKTKRLPALLLALLFLLSSVLTLASCSVEFGSKKPATKEEIAENMEKPDEYATPMFSKVTDYLKHWGLPTFTTTGIDLCESAASLRYYRDGVSAATVARSVSNRFLDEYYDVIDKSNPEAVTLAIDKLYFEELGALDIPALTDEELSAASLTAPADYPYAAQYLLAWGMPAFYAFKLIETETIFRYSYYKTDAIPSAYRLAKSVVDSYLAADRSETFTISEMTDGIIRAYVLEIGDRYATYRTVAEYEEYDGDMSGNYVGIGVVVEYSYAEETLTVTGFPDGSPAEKAGIKLGDILYAVNGELSKDLGYDDTIAKVRGEEGTEVTVTMQRGEEFLDFTVVRKTLADNTVTCVMEDGIAYIRITQFKANTGDLLRDAIDRAEADGVRAFIFDVRSNPGGYLESVAKALSYFVPEGTTIASFSVAGYGVISAYDDHTVNVPCAVLCNGYTASAGELFTAALRDWGSDAFGLLDVTVIGTRTYKKGVMQNTYVLSDESTLTLTVSYYNPPSGVNYDGIGITPDVVLELDAEEDNQKAEAVRILNEKTAAPTEE